MSGSVVIAVFAVALLVAIMLHEAGHFFTARRFGMRADRFFLGFGPTLWSFRRGETEYGVKALPAGGFVSIRGMTPLDERRGPLEDELLAPDALATDRRHQSERGGIDVLEVAAVPATTYDRLEQILTERGAPRDVRERIVDRARRNVGADVTADQLRPVLHEIVLTETHDTSRIGDLRHRLLKGDEGRFFGDRPAWQRAIVLVAGSVMHFLIAIVVLMVGFLALPHGTGVATNVIAVVQPDSAAAAAGLQPGDRVLAAGGTSSTDFMQLRDVIRARPGEATQLTIERGGQSQTLEVTPTATVDEQTGETFGLLGFSPMERTDRFGLIGALDATFVGSGSVVSMAGQSISGIGTVFGPEGIGRIFQQVAGDTPRGADSGMSIVGATAVSGQIATSLGLLSVLRLFAVINVFIGVLNLLPIPPLDGGHLAVLGYERVVNAVRRSRGLTADYSVDARTVAAIAVPFIVLVVVVGAGLIWLDVTNPIQLQ